MKGVTVSPPPPTHITTWLAAEESAAAWMRHWGFRDARITGGSSDGGIDVRSSRGLAQVKFEGHHTGRPALQNLVGAAGRSSQHELLFFSAAGYTKQAREYAQLHQIALFVTGPYGSTETNNVHAETIISRARRSQLQTTKDATPPTQQELDENFRAGCAGCLIVPAAILLIIMLAGVGYRLAQGTFTWTVDLLLFGLLFGVPIVAGILVLRFYKVAGGVADEPSRREVDDGPNGGA